MDVKEIFEKVDKAKYIEALSSDDPNVLKELLEEVGIELNDEQLDHIAGGGLFDQQTC